MKPRKKLTKEIIEKILGGEYAIWIWAQVDGMRPFQMVFPGRAEVHNYPGRRSYFTAPNADDKFYFDEYDYFWFVCKNVLPKEGVINRTPDEYDDALADPEAMPGREKKFDA